MQEMPWLNSHIGSLEEGIEMINKFHWFLEINAKESRWIIKSGESIIFVADTREAVDAFLYGMSLAYAGIPDPLFEELVEQTKNWLE